MEKVKFVKLNHFLPNTGWNSDGSSRLQHNSQSSIGADGDWAHKRQCAILLTGVEANSRPMMCGCSGLERNQVFALVRATGCLVSHMPYRLTADASILVIEAPPERALAGHDLKYHIPVPAVINSTTAMAFGRGPYAAMEAMPTIGWEYHSQTHGH